MNVSKQQLNRCSIIKSDRAKTANKRHTAQTKTALEGAAIE